MILRLRRVPLQEIIFWQGFRSKCKKRKPTALEFYGHTVQTGELCGHIAPIIDSEHPAHAAVARSSERHAHRSILSVLFILKLLPQEYKSIDYALHALQDKPTSFFDMDNPVWVSAKIFPCFYYEVKMGSNSQPLAIHAPPIYQAYCHVGPQQFQGSPALSREAARQSAAIRTFKSLQRVFHRRPTEEYVYAQFRVADKGSSNKTVFLTEHMLKHVRETAERIILTELRSDRFHIRRSSKDNLVDFIRLRMLRQDLYFDAHKRWKSDIVDEDEEPKLKISQEHVALCHFNGRVFHGKSNESADAAIERAARNAIHVLRGAYEYNSLKYLELVAWLHHASIKPSPVLRVISPCQSLEKVQIANDVYRVNSSHYTASCTIGESVFLGISSLSHSSALEMAVFAALRALRMDDIIRPREIMHI